MKYVNILDSYVTVQDRIFLRLNFSLFLQLYFDLYASQKCFLSILIVHYNICIQK